MSLKYTWLLKTEWYRHFPRTCMCISRISFTINMEPSRLVHVDNICDLYLTGALLNRVRNADVSHDVIQFQIKYINSPLSGPCLPIHQFMYQRTVTRR